MARCAVLIMGPTASGKSGLALSMSRQRDALIVNADSMQVYSVLRLLTARPDDAMLAAAPHALYGEVPPSVAFSSGQWLRAVAALIAAGDRDRPLVFVGGTGLYFKALLGGLADMPEVPDAIRERWRYRLAEEGADHLHRLLRREDPEAALSIRPSDGQRIVRALEIKEASGRALSDWQREGGKALVDARSAERLVVMPDRADLHERINRRFDRMVAEGAVDEVRALLGLGLDPALPAMKAIGVREIGAALAGRLPFAEAVDQAKAQTRQYAKRQITWLRHQTGPDWRIIAT